MVVVSALPRVRMLTCSMLSVSMVMAAMLRVRRRRLPLAVSSICSAALEPLKSSVSLPAWPSTVSLPSPGSHWKWSSPAAEEGGVGSDVAVDVVVAFAAVEGVCSVAAAEVVVAVAALQGECGDGGEAVLAGDRVVAVEAGDDQAFDGWVDEDGCGAGCEDGCFGGVACDADLVGLVAAVVAGGVLAVAAGEVHRDLAAGLRPSW